MKKIFTLLGGMLLASTLTANAVETAVYISDEDGKEIAYGFDASLTKDTDGAYTISNLFGYDDDTKGIPFSFKFDQPEVGKYSSVEVTSNISAIKGYDGYYYIKNSNNKYPIFYIYDLNGCGEWVKLRYSFILMGDEGSYAYRYDKSDPQNKYEYYVCLYISGDFYKYNSASEDYDIELDESPWLFVELYFNDPSEANQVAYNKVIATIEGVEEQYTDAVAQIKEVNPDFDFEEGGWTEIASMLSGAKGYALQALSAANSDLADFTFAWTGEEEENFIIEMKKAGFAEPNQKAYDKVIAEIDALIEEYNTVLAEAKDKMPADYDFEGNGWLEYGSMFEGLKTGATQAFGVANEFGEYFGTMFPFDATDYQNIIEEMKGMIPAGIEGIEAEVAAGNAKIFTLDGKSHNAPVKGQVNVIVKENSTRKVMVK